MAGLLGTSFGPADTDIITRRGTSSPTRRSPPLLDPTALQVECGSSLGASVGGGDTEGEGRV